ncbi:MAG: redoxin family protein, partial [Alphaproteobacteria bacterium]|nr:redoxin family protein [Alphaproteobacteria bacterium]
MTISVGDKIPSVDLNIMTQDGPGGISSDEIFSGKTVAIFGLPGAFTRTCSARHLPGFVDNADGLKARGIETIVCIAVNDAFVMAAWGTAQNVGDNVMMVADGS